MRGGEIYVMAPDGSGQTQLTSDQVSHFDPSWSPDGRQIVFHRVVGSRFNHELFRINADGSGLTQLTDTPNSLESHPSWSPDGRQIAFAAEDAGAESEAQPAAGDDGTLQVYVIAADGSARTQLTSPPGRSFAPSWSPDGRQIAFSSDRDGNWEIYVMNRDGSGPTRLTNDPGSDFSPTWSPDGRHIAFERGGDIYVMNADGSATINLTNDPAIDAEPTWSPDGRQIAFTSNRDDRFSSEIYVMNADGSGQTRLTANAAPEVNPTWSPAVPSRAPAFVTFTIQPPEGVGANAVISPAVQIRVTDASGDVVPGGVVRLELGTGDTAGATLSGTTRAKLVDGVATFGDLRVDQPGRGYMLLATAGPASGTSTAFAVVGPSARVAFVTQPPQTVEGGVPIAPPMRVAVQDALGSTVPNATAAVTLALGANPSGGALSGTTTVAAVNGIATFADLSVDRPGSGYTLAATAAGLASATSTTFAAHLTFVAVAAGNWHSCGVAVSGAAYCWGRGGMLGDRTTDDQSRPVPVTGGLRLSMISAYVGPYVDKTCGLARNGAAYCWGTSPALVPGGLTFRTVTAGGEGNSACGVSTDGTAYCWRGGSNPVPVDAAGPSFVSLDAGMAYSCGVTGNGAAYCQGLNDAGQLGDGTYIDRRGFVPVLGSLTFATLSARQSTTCGMSAGHAAYCWGANAAGQLGDGTTTGRTSPVPVTGGLSFVSISTSGYRTCGVATGGAAYCWGGDEGSSPVVVSGGLSFAAVSAGGGHTCGVTPSGAAYCWGDNTYGQLGNGTTTSSSTPVPVTQ